MVRYDVQAVIVFTSPVEKDAAWLSDVSVVKITYPNTKPALPLIGKRPKQQQRRQAPQRQHAFHTYQVSLLLQRVWDESGGFCIQYHHECNGFRGYNLRPSLGAAQSKKIKKRGARTALILALVCKCIKVPRIYSVS